MILTSSATVIPSQDAAHETALRNLLQRRGYASLEDVRNEGRNEGREEGELALAMRLLERAVGQVSDYDRERIRQLDRDGLTALAEGLSGFRAAEDLTAWLERNALGYPFKGPVERPVSLNRHRVAASSANPEAARRVTR